MYVIGNKTILYTVPCGFLLGGISFVVVGGGGGLVVCGSSSAGKFYSTLHNKRMQLTDHLLL